MLRLFFLLILFVTTTLCQLYIPPNTDLTGSCRCDVTAGVCETNCCCDSDCTVGQKYLFATCKNIAVNINPRSCSQNVSSGFGENNEVSIIRSSNWPGCISSNSDPTAFFYEAPVPPQDLITLNALIASGSGFTYSSTSATVTDQMNATFYQQGKPIYSYHPDTQVIDYFIAPSGVGGDVCNDYSVINFLQPRTSSCLRFADATCSSSGFNPSTFYNPLVLPSPSTSLLNNTSVFLSVQCYLASDPGTPVNCSTIVSSGCTSAVNKVTYSLTYNANSNEVVFVEVIIGTTAATPGYVTQTFAVKFQPLYVANASATTNYTYPPRSGNPGYISGKPVLAGFNDTRLGLSTVRLNTDPDLWWTIPGGGKCSTNTEGRQSLLFGINSITACTVNITSTVSATCGQLNQEIKWYIQGLSPPNLIGSWGNSDPVKIGEWVPNLDPNDQSTATSQASQYGCSNMVTGAKIEILYSKTGLRENIQAKILGVRTTYVIGDIYYQCTRPNCNTNSAPQSVHITTGVYFIDASASVQLTEKAKPTFLATLPYDFFHPFFINGCQRLALPATSWLAFIIPLLCSALISS